MLVWVVEGVKCVLFVEVCDMLVGVVEDVKCVLFLEVCEECAFFGDNGRGVSLCFWMY